MLAELLLGSHPFYAPAEAQDLETSNSDVSSICSLDSFHSSWGRGGSTEADMASIAGDSTASDGTSSDGTSSDDTASADLQQQQMSQSASEHTASSCPVSALNASARRQHRLWVSLLPLPLGWGNWATAK